MAAQTTSFVCALKPGVEAEWAQLEYQVPELVRDGDAVQIDHPSGHRLIAGLPSDAEPNTKIVVAVPAGSGTFPPLVAVKREDIVDGKIGTVPTTSSTALKLVEWVENTPACSVCDADFGLFRRTHHCRRCGKCVCSACSPARKCVPGYTEEQRVCNHCVERELQSIIAPDA